VSSPLLVVSYPAHASVHFVAGLAPSARGEFHGTIGAEGRASARIALVGHLLLFALEAELAEG